METHGDKRRQSGWSQEGSDSLQSEVIHSHSGVVHVKKHPVKVHICTNNLKGRGQGLLSQLCFQSDNGEEKHLCTTTLQKGFMAMSSLTRTAGATERVEFIASGYKKVPLPLILVYKYPLKIPGWKK